MVARQMERIGDHGKRIEGGRVGRNGIKLQMFPLSKELRQLEFTHCSNATMAIRVLYTRGVSWSFVKRIAVEIGFSEILWLGYNRGLQRASARVFDIFAWEPVVSYIN